MLLSSPEKVERSTSFASMSEDLTNSSDLAKVKMTLANRRLKMSMMMKRSIIRPPLLKNLSRMIELSDSLISQKVKQFNQNFQVKKLSQNNADLMSNILYLKFSNLKQMVETRSSSQLLTLASVSQRATR
jgi:hypothetical protein